MVLDAINQSGISPEIIISVGQMAQDSLKNKTLYPMVKDAAIRAGLAQNDDFQGKIDYQTLAILAVLGKAAQQMQGSGEMPNV